jgi:hypothetical protein
MAPYEAALAMLEVEGNVAGAAAAAKNICSAPHHRNAVHAAEHAGARAVAEAGEAGEASASDMGIRGEGAELQLCGVEQVCVCVCLYVCACLCARMQYVCEGFRV